MANRRFPGYATPPGTAAPSETFYHGTRSAAIPQSGPVYLTPTKDYAGIFATPEGVVREARLGAGTQLNLTELGAAPVTADNFFAFLEKNGVRADRKSIVEAISSDWRDRPMPVWGWMQNPSVRRAVESSGFDSFRQMERAGNPEALAEAVAVFDPSRVEWANITRPGTAATAARRP